MLKLISKNIRIITLSRRGVVNVRWLSDYSSDDEKPKIKNKDEKVKSTEALKRLNQLLGSMSTTNQAVNVITAKNKRKEAADRMEEKSTEQDPKDLKTITQTIARKIGGDIEKTEAELLSALLGTSTQQKGNLNDIIGGLKIESEKPKNFGSKAQTVKNLMGKSRQQMPRAPREKSHKDTIVNLFGGKPLNIFTETSRVSDPLKTWSALEKRELKLAVTHPPRNYFEKMILWTEEGKVWKFPINNEQGMDEEKKIDFTDHVLLEMHLEDWCPSRGPIRHFMELVCVGLSKNCFITAQEKRDHILWYKEYFESKRDMLGELMSLGIEENKAKQIESS